MWNKETLIQRRSSKMCKWNLPILRLVCWSSTRKGAPGSRAELHYRTAPARAFARYSIVIILLSTFLVLTPVYAQIDPRLQGEIIGLGQQAAIAGLGEQAGSDIDIRVYALRLVRGILGFVGIILVLMIIYGGTLYLTSQGMEEKMEKGKEIIIRAVIGTVIIFSSYGITVFITRQLVKAIYTQMITQAQSCGTSGGQVTCCNEWNAYQTELGATIPLVPIGGGSGATGLEENTAQRQRQAYNRWHDCFERETERAGLDSNLFD